MWGRALRPCRAPIPQVDFVGVNAWGDRFGLYSYCGEYTLGAYGRFWTPSARSQRIIDRLTGLQGS